MRSTPLAELLGQLASRLAPERSSDEQQREIDDILVDNGLDTGAPPWLTDLVAALVDRRRVQRTAFPRDEMDNARWDVTNALAELAMVVPLGYDDHGEGIVLDLEHGLGVRASISREGRDGACTYEVETGERYGSVDATPGHPRATE